jgi:sarcosine oxidase subunit beta
MTESRPTYDVIIIGAGSVGTPAALAAAQAGLRVLVVDKEASPGQESNKKAIGGIRATHSDPAKIRLSLRSIEVFSSWETLYGDDIEWTRGGYCFVAYRQEEAGTLQALTTRQKSFGLNVDWLDAPTTLAAVPGLNPHDLLGSAYSPDDGSASPLLAIHAFYRQAVKLGADFHFREPVTGLEIKGCRVVGVQTTRGAYSAPVVINASGAWAAQVANMAGINVPVRPDAHEAAVTEAVAPFMSPMVVDIRPGPGSSNFYFYQHCTGQVFFCITPRPNIWGFDTSETSTFLPMVAARMIEVMPRLQNLRVRRTWRGLYPMTPDGFPIVGWAPEIDGLMLAVGMCGQGFMLGPALGELIARMVQGSLTPEDQMVLNYLSPTREYGQQELLK